MEKVAGEKSAGKAAAAKAAAPVKAAEEKAVPTKEAKKTQWAGMDLEGTEVLQSKKERDGEGCYAPTAAKKKAGSKNKGGKEGAAKPIRHSAGTFKLNGGEAVDVTEMAAGAATEQPAAAAEGDDLKAMNPVVLAYLKELAKRHDVGTQLRRILAGS